MYVFCSERSHDFGNLKHVAFTFVKPGRVQILLACHFGLGPGHVSGHVSGHVGTKAASRFSNPSSSSYTPHVLVHIPQA